MRQRNARGRRGTTKKILLLVNGRQKRARGRCRARSPPGGAPGRGRAGKRPGAARGRTAPAPPGCSPGPSGAPAPPRGRRSTSGNVRHGFPEPSTAKGVRSYSFLGFLVELQGKRSEARRRLVRRHRVRVLLEGPHRGPVGQVHLVHGSKCTRLFPVFASRGGERRVVGV